MVKRKNKIPFGDRGHQKSIICFCIQFVNFWHLMGDIGWAAPQRVIVMHVKQGQSFRVFHVIGVSSSLFA